MEMESLKSGAEVKKFVLLSAKKHPSVDSRAAHGAQFSRQRWQLHRQIMRGRRMLISIFDPRTHNISERDRHTLVRFVENLKNRMGQQTP